MIQTITYVFDREPKVRRFVYGLSIGLSFLLAFGIPILLGYISRIVGKIYESSSSSSTTPPDYKPFGELIKDGLSTTILALLSFGLPTSGILFLNNLISTTSISDVTIQEIWIIAISSGTLSFMSALGMFIFPSLLIHYSITEETWWDTFRISNINTMVVSVGYLIALVKFFLYSSVFGILSLIITNSVIFLPVSALLVFMYGGITGKLLGDYAVDNREKINI